MSEAPSPERWRQIEPILDAALPLGGLDRQRYLDQACAEDPTLRSEVESLLQAATDSGMSFLEAELGGYAATWIERLRGHGDTPEVSLPERIGPYRVVDQLGSGGMGDVLLAERADGHFEATVAVKLIRQDVLSADAERRFLQERQILARLQHPNIAHLLDGGISEEGLPYLAMEHVDGRSLLEFCDQRRLSIDERLRLFLAICSAVEYAHRNLVVHRDLKPNNILMTSEGEPKLLDFGIAKILDADTEQGAESTGGEATRGTRLMTPSHAAPEQLAGGAVTTATDVYALGLVLYELLTGATPFPSSGKSAIELQRLRLESDPVRPSTAVLAASEGTDDATARARGARHRELARRLRGDLDNILEKTLRREPLERYSSVEALRIDIQRHLEGLPIVGVNAGLSYRALKFARRHRVVLGVVALLLLSLMAGLLATARQARRAREAESVATAINRFLLEDLLGAASPEVAQGEKLTVEEALEAASITVERSFSDRPEIEAAVRATIGETYLSLGEVEDAGPHLRRSRQLLAEIRGDSDPETLKARAREAALLREQGQLDSARQVLEEVLERQLRSMSEDDVDVLRTRSALGEVLHLSGEWSEAETMLQQTLETLSRAHPQAWRDSLATMSHLSTLLRDQRKSVEAEELSRRTLELQRSKLGASHPDLIETLGIRGLILRQLERLDEAIVVQEQALELSRRVLGENHRRTLSAMNGLGRIYYGQEHYDEAESIWREAGERSRDRLGEEHPLTIGIYSNLGILLRNVGRLEEAEVFYRSAVALRAKIYGEENPSTIRALKNLTALLETQGRERERTDVVERILEIGRRYAALSDIDPIVLSDFAEYLLVCRPEELRDPDLALALAQRAAEQSRGRHPEPLMTLAQAHRAHGSIERALDTYLRAARHPGALHLYVVDRDVVALYQEKNDPEGAEEFLLERLELRRASRSPDDPLIGYSLIRLARHYLERRMFVEAEQSSRQAVAQFAKRLSDEHWRLLAARAVRGSSLSSLGRFEEAERELLPTFLLFRDDPIAYASEKREVLGWLIDLYVSWGRPVEAEKWQAELEAHRDLPERGVW